MKKKNKHISKNQPFEVPEGYFETLSQRLMTIPSQHPHKKPGVFALSTIKRYRHAWAAAATFVIALSIAWIVIPAKKIENTYQHLTSQEIYLMVENGYFSVPESILWLEFTTEEIKDLSHDYYIATDEWEFLTTGTYYDYEY